MEVQKISLNSSSYQTSAYLQLYLQTPTPHSPQQQFDPLIILPGGSMTHISWAESEKTAIAFAARGYQVMILRYSFIRDHHPLYPYPLLDLKQALKTLDQNIDQWHLSKRRFVLAFSAGAHIAALYNDYWSSSWLDGPAVDAFVLGYPVIDLDAGFPKNYDESLLWTDQPAKFNASQHVNAHNSPTFLWHTMNDPLVPVENTLKYSQALRQAGITQEVHLFAHGPHGMDIANRLVSHHPDGNQPHVAHWVQLADEWLQEFNNKV